MKFWCSRVGVDPEEEDKPTFVSVSTVGFVLPLTIFLLTGPSFIVDQCVLGLITFWLSLSALYSALGGFSLFFFHFFNEFLLNIGWSENIMGFAKEQEISFMITDLHYCNFHHLGSWM